MARNVWQIERKVLSLQCQTIKMYKDYGNKKGTNAD